MSPWLREIRIEVTSMFRFRKWVGPLLRLLWAVIVATVTAIIVAVLTQAGYIQLAAERVLHYFGFG